MQILPWTRIQCQNTCIVAFLSVLCIYLICSYLCICFSIAFALFCWVFRGWILDIGGENVTKLPFCLSKHTSISLVFVCLVYLVLNARAQFRNRLYFCRFFFAFFSLASSDFFFFFSLSSHVKVWSPFGIICDRVTCVKLITWQNRSHRYTKFLYGFDWTRLVNLPVGVSSGISKYIWYVLSVSNLLFILYIIYLILKVNASTFGWCSSNTRLVGIGIGFIFFSLFFCFSYPLFNSFWIQVGQAVTVILITIIA